LELRLPCAHPSFSPQRYCCQALGPLMPQIRICSQQLAVSCSATPIGATFQPSASFAPAKSSGIRDMIGAASQNAGEEELAEANFTQALLSSAYPGAEENAFRPTCEAVVGQFDRLERHHQQAGYTDHRPGTGASVGTHPPSR